MIMWSFFSLIRRIILIDFQKGFFKLTRPGWQYSATPFIAITKDVPIWHQQIIVLAYAQFGCHLPREQAMPMESDFSSQEERDRRHTWVLFVHTNKRQLWGGHLNILAKWGLDSQTCFYAHPLVGPSVSRVSTARLVELSPESECLRGGIPQT